MKNKGITLVALVVTIVIMLILAGVALNLALGDNGLFKMASQTVEKYKTAQSEEESTMQELVDELHGIIGKGKDDKTPGVIDGEGTEAKPFFIESIEDLVEFSNKVNSGTTYENQIVKLAVNLDFQSEDSYVDSKNKTYGDINGTNGAEELKTELTTGTGFKSIGNNNQQFKGTFDGQNRTISNLYINVAENYKGLFGYVGNNGSIKNLTISNANINCEAENIGTLVGYVDGGTIENVRVNKGLLVGNRNVGGIVGRCINNTTIKYCINESEILAKGIISNASGTYFSVVGGISGEVVRSSILNSYNTGIVHTEKGMLIGGIVGAVTGNSSLINSCFNNGKVGELLKEKDVKQVGGIAGAAYENAKILQCYNMNMISGENSVGGLVGTLGYQSKSYIEDSYNLGAVNATGKYIGGISGVADSTTGSEIKNCYNTGIISGYELNNSYSGSIVGTGNEENTKVTNCYYLSGTYEGGINGKDTDGTVKKEQGEMITQEFVDLLNSGSEEKPWKKGKEYPILSWQD